jgi:hypothetical protein
MWTQRFDYMMVDIRVIPDDQYIIVDISALSAAAFNFQARAEGRIILEGQPKWAYSSYRRPRQQ